MGYENQDMERMERRRRTKRIKEKQRRVQQIRRRVCLLAISAVCMITGAAAIITHTGRKEEAQETNVHIWIDTAVIIEEKETENATLQLTGDGTGGAEAGQQEKPVFVCLPVPMSEAEQRIVFDTCADNNVAFSLVMAVIGQESGFQKEARSATGDSGYMQINDCNQSEMAERGFVDMYDTAQNVGAGVSILCDLFRTYGDDEVHRVLMAYNMGANAAAELWAQGIETSEYSREVVEREAEYSRYMDECLKG